MRVMTFNLRFENQIDGKNSWHNRRDLVTAIIRKYLPSIVGTQEGTPGQLHFLEEQLTEYAICDSERLWDGTCQYPTLFYRSEELDAKSGGEFWLSTTPMVHRTKDWDSAFPRMMSYAQFECRSTGTRLWSIVTHLDHIGTEARSRQAEIISNWVRELDGPVVLMGDFNVGPDSPVHALLTSAECGLQDTWEALNRPEDIDSMTYHAFLGAPQLFRIDWILASRHFQTMEAHIIRDHIGDLYPSDHFPYMAELEFV